MKMPNINLNFIQVLFSRPFHLKINSAAIPILVVAILWWLNTGFRFPQGDFGGTWELNIAASDFPNLNPNDAAPKNIKVVQAKDSIIIEKLFTHSDGSQNSYAERFNFDGSPTERMASPTTRRVTTIKWSENKDTLFINARAYVDDRGFKWEYTTSEKWNLSLDKQSLLVQRKTVAPDRTETYKAIYEKR